MSNQQSKYDPLQSYLGDRTDRELPMAFRDVERVLGFPLPPSARRHPAWWSNNRGTNVAVKAWRDAGWRTSRVDIGGEKVVFVRDEDRTDPSHCSQSSTETPSSHGAISIERSSLSPAGIRLLEDYAEGKNFGLGEAAAEVLNAVASERRRQLVERFRAMSPNVTGDSTDLIREDRDAR
ncbi:MAG: hypothetical protein ACHP84_14385 [Caulobacterales bacterium]